MTRFLLLDGGYIEVINFFLRGNTLYHRFDQWEFQDPIHGGTLVPYVSPYFMGIFPEI